ncbi:hypothetical protein BH11ARM2_BH11ARM2_02640 [soil metagenome]
MIRSIRALAPILFLTALSLAGCGGSDDSGTSGNTYAGNYTGSYNSEGIGDSGTVRSLTISSNGEVSGTWHSASSNTDGTASGTIQNNGSFSGSVTFGQNTSNLSGTFTPFSGTQTVGTITQTQGGSTVTLTVTLNRLLQD